MSYTKGPWKVHDNRDLNNAIWICSEHPEWGTASLAEVRSGGDEADELGDVLANAHLIAAAPEMVDMLKSAWGCIEHLKQYCPQDEKKDATDTMSEIEFVLAKAKGE